jgi:hypothetical protein
VSVERRRARIGASAHEVGRPGAVLGGLRGDTLRRVDSDDVYTAVQRATYPDGSDWYVVIIGEVKDGSVWRTQTLFAQTFDPPAWRSRWVDVRERR